MLCSPARTANSSDLGGAPAIPSTVWSFQTAPRAEASKESLPSNPRRAESPPIERPSLPSVLTSAGDFRWPLSGRKAIRDLRREKRERECSPLPMPRAWCPAPIRRLFFDFRQPDITRPKYARNHKRHARGGCPRKESSEAHAAEFPGSSWRGQIPEPEEEERYGNKSSRRARSRAPVSERGHRRTRFTCHRKCLRTSPIRYHGPSFSSVCPSGKTAWKRGHAAPQPQQ